MLWGPDNDNVEECFEHVADGVAACICPAAMVAFHRRADIAWIPIVAIDPLNVADGRRSDNDAPLVRRLTDVVTNLITAQGVAVATEPKTFWVVKMKGWAAMLAN